MQIHVDDHPLLRVRAFGTQFPAPLGALSGGAAGAGRFFGPDAAAPVTRDEVLRRAVRDMLRVGGYKPTGRGKPASEYLVRAAEAGELAGINVAVDACNAVSLHSGFPISVVAADLVTPPLRVATAGAGARYVFNRAGHEIDLDGLVCLFDAGGPCANAVKDAQRTKTRPETTSTLSVIWGVAGFEERLDAAVAWYRELLAAAGATTAPII